jgi:hypothetical protein
LDALETSRQVVCFEPRLHLDHRGVRRVLARAGNERNERNERKDGRDGPGVVVEYLGAPPRATAIFSSKLSVARRSSTRSLAHLSACLYVRPKALVLMASGASWGAWDR